MLMLPTSRRLSSRTKLELPFTLTITAAAMFGSTPRRDDAGDRPRCLEEFGSLNDLD